MICEQTRSQRRKHHNEALRPPGLSLEKWEVASSPNEAGKGIMREATTSQALRMGQQSQAALEDDRGLRSVEKLKIKVHVRVSSGELI